MGLNEILQWWNLIYVAPLVVSLLWIVATVASGAHGAGGHGHEIGHDVGHGIGHVAHDVGHAIGHAVHHGDAGHDVGHSGAGHAAHGHDAHGHDAHGHDTHGGARDQGAGAKALSLLGIGRVPITLLIGVFLFCWGAFGMAVNQLFEGIMKYPAIYIWPSMALTFVVSFTLTRSMAAVVGRFIPATETYGVTRFELVGSMGKTVFPTGENTGTVDINDPSGTVHRMQAKTEPGAEVIPTGSEVMVLDFDEEDKRFVVRISTL